MDDEREAQRNGENRVELHTANLFILIAEPCKLMLEVGVPKK